MEAVRQIHKVKNSSITIQLPVDFEADEVEVIVLPAQRLQNGTHREAEHEQQSDYEIAVQNILTMDTSHFTEEQMIAYARTCDILRRGRAPGDPPVWNAFAGLITIADDFDEPLPDDILELFYGSESDEYGLSLL
jgi:hypothetical protein